MWYSKAANSVKESQELDRGFNMVTCSFSEHLHLIRLWLVTGIGAAVDSVDLLTQSPCLLLINASITAFCWLHNPTVIDHASYATDCEGASAQSKHPYLFVAGIILDDELVSISAFFGNVVACGTIEQIVKECAA